jgi:hypothetical protein
MFVVKSVGSSSNGSAPCGNRALAGGGWDSAVVGATVDVGAAVVIGAADVDNGVAAAAVVVSRGFVSAALVEISTVPESLAHEVATRIAATSTEE